MGLGAATGFATSGWSNTPAPGSRAPFRQGVTFEAKINPQAPHEYTAQLIVDDAEPSLRTAQTPKDPASKAYLGISNFKSTPHRIDIFV